MRYGPLWHRNPVVLLEATGQFDVERSSVATEVPYGAQMLPRGGAEYSRQEGARLPRAACAQSNSTKITRDGEKNDTACALSCAVKKANASSILTR